MLEFFGISDEGLITFLSALIAAVSFMAFASMFLDKEEKKERYKDIVQKRRRALYEDAKAGRDRTIVTDKELSARESMAMLYKMQDLLGAQGKKIRNMMVQAGYRSPKAPINFMVARVGLPVFFLVFSFLVFSALPEERQFSKMVQLCVYFGGFAFGFFLPGIIIKNQIQKRQQDMELSFPDALDMMLICVQGGIGLEQTIDRISNEIVEQAPILAEELGILSAEMSMLNNRRAALADFARRLGNPAAKSFTTALVQAEQYGTSVSQALRILSEELRDIRMQRAEEKAMSLPPKLTVPMILFFLPSLFVIILGPVGIQISNM
ncbi:MAG: type II secretion system F family protein [Rhodospirillales bacterium]|nr:type II secretion system F family protein [Rhodospirillales bacterium]